jgi:hypothetical protein
MKIHFRENIWQPASHTYFYIPKVTNFPPLAGDQGGGKKAIGSNH